MARRRYSKRKRAGRDVYWTRYRDAYGKRIYLRAYSEQELVTKLSEAQIETKTAPAPANIRDTTLSEYAEPWLRRVKAHRKYGTAITYRQTYAIYLEPELGKFKLRELTRQHVKLLIDRLLDQGFSKATLRLIRAVLSGMLGEALEDEIVKTNVALSIGGRNKRPDSSSEIEDQAAIRPFSESQVEDLLASARDQQDRTPLMLLARTGMRPGEAAALRWSDFDSTAREILVERALYRGHLGTPKTGRRRRVDMSQELARALPGLYIQREREKLQGLHAEIPDWTFCCDRNGQSLTHSAITAVFRRTLRHAHLSDHTIYDLRHTFASLLLQNGAPLTYVSVQLGHKGPAVTLKYYSHHIPTGDKRWIDGLDRHSGTSLAPMRPILAPNSEKPL
jgi:integrase